MDSVLIINIYTVIHILKNKNNSGFLWINLPNNTSVNTLNKLLNAKYPNDFTNKELADLIKNDLRKFEKKGKPISGRVRCEYDPDAAVGSRYSLVEMKPNESYDDYISPEYGYLDK